MKISLADINYYRDSLNQIGKQASEYVYESIVALSTSIGVTAMREAAIKAIQESVGIHGDMAQSLAEQLFYEVCNAEGITNVGFELVDDIIDFSMLEDKVRYFAKFIVEHDGGDRFLNDCSQLAEFYARRCNWESMVKNCERNNVRYARVPTGAETCAWCLMLASRGFDYHSRESAEHANHNNCDCIVVCGGESTSIEGYDTQELYDKWNEIVTEKAKRRAEKNGTDVAEERSLIIDKYKKASVSSKQKNRLNQKE